MPAPSWSGPSSGGAARYAGYDNDGRMNLALTVHGGRPLRLHSESVDAGDWIYAQPRQIGAQTRGIGVRFPCASAT